MATYYADTGSISTLGTLGLTKRVHIVSVIGLVRAIQRFVDLR